MATLPPFTGAVLTGGACRRLGRDKALVALGGRPLAAIAAAGLIEAGADGPVLAIGGNGPALRRLGLEPVPDRHPGQGPLGGVVTALSTARHEVVMVLACDVPGAHAAAVALVVATLAGAPDADVAVPVLDGRRQPLHAAWRRSALPRIGAVFDRGERAVRRALEDLASVDVTGVAPEAVADVDTPADLERHGWSNLVAIRQTGAMSETPQPEVDVDRLAEVAAEGAWVLDVRQPDEYEAGHVPGAHLIPLDQLSTRHGEVPHDQEVYVVCGGGGRSAVATEALNGAGYRAVNVAGGTRGWIDAGNPVISGTEPT